MAHTGASSPGAVPIAGAVPTAGASTLGFATPEDLRVGSWNMGLPQANSFAKFGKIYGLLEDAAQKIKLMGEYCHVIVLNELHVAHQGGQARLSVGRRRPHDEDDWFFERRRRHLAPQHVVC